MEAVNRASAGSAAVSRNRLKESAFLDIDFLLPPLDVQRVIVQKWREARAEVDAAREELQKIAEGLDQRLWDIYRNSIHRDVVRTRAFALNNFEFDCWDIKSCRAAAYIASCPTFMAMKEFIEDATELVRPFKDPEKLWPVYGVNNKQGVFLSDQQLGRDFNSPYKRIRKNWFYHNPTRCNVGSLGIVPDVPDDAITSPEYQVWRLKEGAEKPLIPGFLDILIHTSFFLALIEFNRVGAVKQRMYFENLCEVRIPYFSVEEQNQIAGRRSSALTRLHYMEQRLELARVEIEAAILGAEDWAGKA